MKRFLILFMILGLIAGSVATAEAKKKTDRATRVERTVEGRYGPYPSPVTGCNEPLGPWTCVTIPTRMHEAFLTAKVTDAHGQPVFVEVSSGGGRIGAFCGETKEPISFSGGSTLYFYVALNNWGASLHCPAHRIKTTGTISVTLSNHAHAQPVRSGSIVTGTGWLLDGQIGGCQMSPECAAWLHIGCEQALAEWDPGLTASIVDVDELADGPPVERVFKIADGWPSGPVWGGAHLQFWTRDCAEITEARWRSTDCDGDESGRNCSSRRFLIPPTAKWMTVTGYQDNVNLFWTLT